MRSVPIREAKAKFSELIDAAEKGEEIMVTRHGKPAAKIVSGVADDEREKPKQKTFLEFLMEFPGGIDFERDTTPSREIDL